MLLGNCTHPIQISNECGRDPVVQVEKNSKPRKTESQPKQDAKITEEARRIKMYYISFFAKHEKI